MNSAIKDELIDIALSAAIQGLPADITKRILEVAVRADTPSKPSRPVLTKQPSILSEPISVGKADSLVVKYVNRYAIGETVSSKSVCAWVEHDMAIPLTEADLYRKTDRDSPRWRQRISQALSKLRDKGFLQNAGLKGSYVILRKP